MEKERLQDKCRGSLVGGAIGDALGYAVEFYSLSQIRHRYGAEGIQEYELEGGVAVFSDDTQMTLFTAEGILRGLREGKEWGIDLLPYIKDAYLDWYKTQTSYPTSNNPNQLLNVPQLWKRRAPGNTCMSALSVLSDGGEVKNNSKGCGGVMRVAPFGIFSAANCPATELFTAGQLAGAAADLTHKHPSSTFASMAMAMIVDCCIRQETIDREGFIVIVDNVFRILNEIYPDNQHLIALQDQLTEALQLAVSDIPDTEGVRRLGEGWVGDEALAIAVFCVMRYVDDFRKCIVCAVNHSGDSDSTGAIAGNIIGAILGYSNIPACYRSNIELSDLLFTIADALNPNY